MNLNSQIPEWSWVSNAGSSGADHGSDVCIDDQGNTYITGYFYNTCLFGSVSLISSGNSDVYIAKLDPNGDFLWACKAGGPSTDYGYGIKAHGAFVYVVGHFSGTASFGTTSLVSSGGFDVFCAKLDQNGNYIWAKKASGQGDDIGYGICSDSEGNSYITGYVGNSATFGSITTSNYGSYVAKLDTTGSFQWVTRLGVTKGYRIEFSIDGFLLFCGAYGASYAKLDTNGNVMWNRITGGTEAMRIISDPSGGGYLAGYFSGTASFGSTTLCSSGSNDIFLAKFDNSGAISWAIKGGGSGDDICYGLAVDSNGNAFITGRVSGNSIFGSQSFTGLGCYDVFLAKVSQEGDYLWAMTQGGSGNDIGLNLCIDNMDNCILTGLYSNYASIGGTVLTSMGNTDIFAAKLGNNMHPNPSIHDLVVSQRSDVSKKVDIYYRINYMCPVTVLLNVSNDNGTTWSFPCLFCPGDIGNNISPGNGKHIVWDVLAEHPNITGSNFKFKITASD